LGLIKRRLLIPVDVMLLGYIAITCTLIAIFHARSEYWLALLGMHLLIAAIILLIAQWHRATSGSTGLSARAALFAHGWYPVLLIFALYGQLRAVVPLVHPHLLDVTLANIDYSVLGVYPTVWLERWARPLITELLQLTYATYYFLPLILGIVLWRRSREHFQLVYFALALGFALSYFGYMLVPAIGPRFTPAVLAMQTQPLRGVWLFPYLRDWLDVGEGVTPDCFPSGHTEVTLLVLIFAFRYARDVFWWLLPIGSALIFSTVYLRYHYAVDVVAGAALAVIVATAAQPLYLLTKARLATPALN
jgi:membrane-associated phospholipid phosphatase